MQIEIDLVYMINIDLDGFRRKMTNDVKRRLYRKVKLMKRYLNLILILMCMFFISVLCLWNLLRTYSARPRDRKSALAGSSQRYKGLCSPDGGQEGDAQRA